MLFYTVAKTFYLAFCCCHQNGDMVPSKRPQAPMDRGTSGHHCPLHRGWVHDSLCFIPGRMAFFPINLGQMKGVLGDMAAFNHLVHKQTNWPTNQLTELHPSASFHHIFQGKLKPSLFYFELSMLHVSCIPYFDFFAVLMPPLTG